MAFPKPKPHFFLLFHVIILTTTTSTSTSTTTNNDLTTLIYKGCANQNFQNNNPTQTLNTLFNNLVQHSLTSNFYKTTSNSTIPITGLYQCRGDLSHTDCNTCVQTLQNVIQTVCNPNTLAARAHLTGCYMMYEAVNFPQVVDTEVLYKKCGSGRVESGTGSGFGEKMEVVFGMVVKGVGEGKGYYAGGYEGVYVLGQCEGDLGESECVDCVRNASLVAKGECLDSGFVSGHVYLQRCWLSYTFYPDGVPGGNGNGDVGGGAAVETGAAEVGGGSGSGGGGKRNTEKTVAIVFGGLAVVLLLVAFLLVLKSAFRKKKEHHYYYGDHAGHAGHAGHHHHVGH